MSKSKNDNLIKELLDIGRFVVTTDGWVLSNGRRVGHKSHKDKDGYRYILYKFKQNGKVISRSLMEHRMIWISLFGDIPPDLEINHIDGIKSNNDPSNLELVTCSQNQIHALNMGLAIIGKGNNARHKKYSFEIAEEIRKRYMSGESISQIAKSMGHSTNFCA